MVKIPQPVRNPLFGAAVCCAFFIYSGLVVPHNRHQFICMLRPDDICRIEGTLSSNPVKTNRFNGSYSASFSPYRAHLDNGSFSSCTGSVTVFFPADSVESIYPGKLFTASKSSGIFTAETGCRAVLSVSSVPDSAHKGCVCFCVSSVTGTGWHKGIKGIVDKFRAQCRLSFRRILSYWGPAGGLFLALLSGSRDYTEQCLSDSFKRAGLAHILALSGMHLSLFSGFASFIGKKAASIRIAQGLQLFSILFFVWFAGLSPSLLRALLCSLILFTMNMLRMKRLDAVNVLGTAFLAHTVIFPADVVSASFMLSYGALAGILIISPYIKHLFSRRFFPKLSSSFSDSCSAQLFTAPVTATLFGTLTPGGIPASVIVSPLVTVFIYAGLVCFIVSLALPFLSPLIRDTMIAFYAVIKGTVMLFAAVPPVTI